MISHKQVEKYLLSMFDTHLDYPFGKEAAVYKVGPEGRGKMFAIIAEGSKPVSLSLKADPQLSEVLRAKYESVMPGYHLNKKHWNTIVLTGQIKWPEIQGLIRHSYDLVTSRA